MGRVVDDVDDSFVIADSGGALDALPKCLGNGPCSNCLCAGGGLGKSLPYWSLADRCTLAVSVHEDC